MNTSTVGIPKAGLPEGFVYIDELIEDCIIDAKYAGTDNFMGRPAAGYEQPLVVMSRELADCCIKAADTLRKQGYIMKFFDAYRPQSAVDDFCRWGEDLKDIRRKSVHYPNIDKAEIFDQGYIARRLRPHPREGRRSDDSGHAYASGAGHGFNIRLYGFPLQPRRGRPHPAAGEEPRHTARRNARRGHDALRGRMVALQRQPRALPRYVLQFPDKVTHMEKERLICRSF